MGGKGSGRRPKRDVLHKHDGEIDWAATRRLLADVEKRDPAAVERPRRGPTKRELGDAQYQRERRQRLRQGLLDRVAPDRRCVLCGALKPGRQQLVVVSLDGRLAALCRGCKWLKAPGKRTVNRR